MEQTIPIIENTIPKLEGIISYLEHSYNQFGKYLNSNLVILFQFSYICIFITC